MSECDVLVNCGSLKALFMQSATASGFQITFDTLRFFLIGKCNGGLDSPGFHLTRASRRRRRCGNQSRMRISDALSVEPAESTSLRTTSTCVKFPIS